MPAWQAARAAGIARVLRLPTTPACLPACNLKQETMELVRTKGLFSFYEDGHGECCRVRKVRARRPLGRGRERRVGREGRGGLHTRAAAHPCSSLPVPPTHPPTPTTPPATQVRPLRRQLTGLKAWITGQRKDQSPGTRMAVPAVQVGAGWVGGRCNGGVAVGRRGVGGHFAPTHPHAPTPALTHTHAHAHALIRQPTHTHNHTSRSLSGGSSV